MSTEAKPSTPTTPSVPTSQYHEKPIRIFMWPKVIFLYPSALIALICWAGMWIIQDQTVVPIEMGKVDRFMTPQNLLGVLFLVVLAFNLIVMALDFPRFSLVAVILGVCFLLFFILWLGAYFHLDLMRPIHAIYSHIYAVANRGFYLMFFVTLMLVFGVIWITRWLDYWEILPNEILHHHGPLSDLERYPTMNLKFDKEIPDVLEYAMLGAGRLALHVPNVPKAIVLDNVLFISGKEKALKRTMSRLEVRITTDQEAGETVM
jgi:hypothetical protein